MTNEIPQELLWELAGSSKVVALTGAGVSAEVGIPTFRGPDGLWEGVKLEEVATPEAFKNNSQFVWNWYRERRLRMREVNFGVSHKALAELETIIPEFILLTQNIDGLHAKAGSKNVIELHGNIWFDRCSKCGVRVEASMEQKIPRCKNCGGLMRPDVVWFNEPLPEEALNEAFEASASCQFFLSIGTSALVQPAASLPLIAKNNGAFLLEINPNETPLTYYANWSFRRKSAEILPAIVENLRKILKV